MQDEFYPDMPQTPQGMPGPSSDAVYADVVREKKIENLLSQINPDNLLADIESRIRGYRKDRYSNQWIQIPGTRLVSEKLVGNFMSFLGGILNNNTTLSNCFFKSSNFCSFIYSCSHSIISTSSS